MCAGVISGKIGKDILPDLLEGKANDKGVKVGDRAAGLSGPGSAGHSVTEWRTQAQRHTYDRGGEHT